MSGNRPLIERFYETANRDDLEALPRLVSPRLRWEWPRGMAVTGVYEGHEGLVRGMQQWRDSWDELRMDPLEILERDDEAFILVRYKARGRVSGIEVDENVAHVIEVRDGLMVRFRMFGDPDKARRRFLLEHAYRRFNATGEFDWELLDPDVEWNAFRFAPVWQYYGHAGVRQWLADVGGMFEELRIEPEEFVDAGDRVVVVSRMRGRGKGSGADVEQALVSVWTFRDERIVRHDAYQDRKEALASIA
jgi:ketosteroid isomerase-like protein